jgi:hypothetical protein
MEHPRLQMESAAAADVLGKRKREVFYDLAPLMAPIGFKPYFTGSLEMAEWCVKNYENYYRNKFYIHWDWDESAGSDKHISISITYPESYLFDWGFTESDFQLTCV